MSDLQNKVANRKKELATRNILKSQLATRNSQFATSKL